ncbi:MAG: hypothetical protein AAF226_05745, partial [Verrucomicrobiota bacterium]
PTMMARTMPSASSMGAEEQEAMDSMMEFFEVFASQVWVHYICLFISLMLFVGGVMLLMRYRVSRLVLLGYSVGKLIFGSLAVVMMALAQKKMMSAMTGMMTSMEEELSESDAAMFDSGVFAFYESGATIGMVIGIIWNAALPVFLLIWLMRKVIRTEIATSYHWR